MKAVVPLPRALASRTALYPLISPDFSIRLIFPKTVVMDELAFFATSLLESLQFPCNILSILMSFSSSLGCMMKILPKLALKD